MNTADQRRFGGISRLFGTEGFNALGDAHVIVVGVGGVGSWAAEALARTAVGHITLIDADTVEQSNTNRQLPALEGTYGKKKVEVLGERLKAINPECDLQVIDAFVTQENLPTMIPTADVIIDAIDSLRDKAALIAYAKNAEIPIVVSGGAGGKFDPQKVACDDLARAVGDGLIAAVRTRLRKEFGFPKGRGNPKQVTRWGIDAVYSDEACLPSQDGGEGFGVFVGVTATFGMLLAQRAVERILKTSQNHLDDSEEN